MKLSDIVANARITCEQNNVEFNDFLKLCIMEELGINNQFNPEDTDIFAESLEEQSLKSFEILLFVLEYQSV